MSQRLNNPKDDVLRDFYKELQLVSAHQRSLIIVTHGFVELLINTIIDDKCKNGKDRITANNRDYPQSVKLVLLHELGLIDDRLFKILDWFRKLRNRAAHEPFFELTTKDIDFVNHSMDRFVPNVPKQKDILRFCMYLIGTVWNNFLDILRPAFYNKTAD